MTLFNGMVVMTEAEAKLAHDCVLAYTNAVAGTLSTKKNDSDIQNKIPDLKRDLNLGKSFLDSYRAMIVRT